MSDTFTGRIRISNVRGFHARASAKFVKLAESFEAEVSVYKSSTKEAEPVKVSGKSILGLMMLAAEPGSTIEIEASGPDAGEALDALTELVKNKFEEE